MINKVTEVVGIGHPDKLADRISDYVRKLFETAGVETMVRYNHLNNSINTAIFADVQLKKGTTLVEIEEEIRHYLADFLLDIWRNYHVKHKTLHLPELSFNFVFSPQDGDLNSRSKTNLSGDQEVVYRTVHELHNNLKEVSIDLSKDFPVLDWKLLVNKQDKIVNFSCSTSCHKYNQKKIVKRLTENLKKYDYYDGYKLHYCWFEGGSIFNDVGVTGRKLIFDADGCGAPHGGGAWSGKDITKAAVVGRKYLEEHNIEGAAVYIPKQNLDKPTIIKKKNESEIEKKETPKKKQLKKTPDKKEMSR